MPENPPIQFDCPHCQRRIKVKAEAAGRRSACPNPECKQPIVVPTSDQAVPVARRADAYQVFVSYSAKDKKWGDAACAALESLDIGCWIAPRDIVPGTEWGASIIGGIDACKVMVLVFSAQANESPQVRREVERAIHKGLVIVPLRVEKVNPSGALEYALSNTHWLDAFEPPMDVKMRELAHAVKALLEGSVKPPRVATKLGQPHASPFAPVQPAKSSRSISLLFLPIAALVMLLGCGCFGGIGWWWMYSSSGKDGPDNKKEIADNGEKPKDKDSAKLRAPQTLIDENFVKTFENRMVVPDGWSNPIGAFAVAKDKNGKPCLRMMDPTGEHFVELPSRTLTTRFFIEVEFLTHYNHSSNGPGVSQVLVLELDSQKGGKKLRVVVEPESGLVTVGNKIGERPPTFKPGKGNTIRLVRKADVVTVEVNEEHLSLAAFSGLADFDTVRIGLIAGEPATFGPGSWARIYRVKIETLPP